MSTEEDISPAFMLCDEQDTANEAVLDDDPEMDGYT